MKRFISIMLTFALVISTITVGNVTKVEADDQWKANAITIPAEGDLIGAGYIDVEFDNSMEGYTYTVYLDGKPMYWIGDDIVRTDIGETVTDEAVTKTYTSDDLGKTEVYTTKVSKHELVVKATNGTEEIVSDTRTFYVSKKGMALGGDMSDKVSLSKLNCSWYYNWASEAFNNSVDAGVSHVPMMWGGAEDNIESISNMTSTANYILGFNEPDIKSQANMEFWDAAEVWNNYIRPINKRKVSPAPAAPGGDSGWLKRFMNGDYICKSPLTGEWGLYYDYEDDETKTWVEGCADDVDAVVLHYYRNQINLQGMFDAVETLWNTYHKPIWITEISIFGMKGTYTDFSYELEDKREEMAEYVQGMVEGLDEIPYVERYCWFSYDIDSSNEIDSFNGSGATAMFEYASGLYTELGKLYSSIGNPEGYNAEVVSDDEMFVYVPKEETTAEPTTEPITTTVPTTTPNTTTKEDITPKATTTSTTTAATVKKPAKVSIKSAKNIKKKSVKLTWKKAKGAKKYQVQCSMNRKFKSAKKYKTKTWTTNKLTITIKKLTKKKTYYFRVRGINGKIIGKWSNVKTVKVNK